MRQLLPVVEGFLELGVALVEQNINDAQLANVAVLLELLADLGTDDGYGHVQGVHGLDLGGGAQPLPVRLEDSELRIVQVEGGTRPLREEGRVDSHSGGSLGIPSIQ